MQEYRCKFCHRLLFKILTDNVFTDGFFEFEKDVVHPEEPIDILEIKCPKCNTINSFTSKDVIKV
jgi:phage FluMu protein Com